MKHLLRFVILAALLVFGAGVSAQDDAPDCAPAALNRQVDLALSAYFTTRSSGDEAEAQDALTALVDELDSLQAACDSAALASAEDTTEPNAAFAFYDSIPQERLDDGGFVLGDPEAPVTLVLFADFACPHCQNYFSTVKQFIEEYVATGQARLEYRMFISGADPVYGPYTAQLAECAEVLRPGGFWAAHDAIYELSSGGRFSSSTAPALAERLGLDHDELVDCAETAAQYEDDIVLGRELGVSATPTLMLRSAKGVPQFIKVDGETLSAGGAPYEVLEMIVSGFAE